MTTTDWVASPRRWQKEMGKIAGIIFVALILTGAGFIWRSVTYERYGFEVDGVDWLPSEARNITFYEDGLGNKKAEFEIDRDEFLRWCAEIGRPLEVLEEEDRDAHVFRALDILEYRGVIEPLENEGRTLEELEARLSRHSKRFEPGDLYHGEVWMNGGGYRIGYDSKDGKGYYSYSRN